MEKRFGGAKAISDIIAEKNIIIKGGDAFTQSGFTMVPNAILKSDKLSPGAKLCYAMLLSYAWHNDYCFPGQDRLANDIGISRQSVNTQIKEIERKGFIKIKRQGQGRPNIYEINLKAKGMGAKS